MDPKHNLEAKPTCNPLFETRLCLQIVDSRTYINKLARSVTAVERKGPSCEVARRPGGVRADIYISLKECDITCY